MTHPSKTKGDRGEREVADLLRAVFPEARRRVNGEESQDDLPGRDVQGVPGYCVQVRVYAKDARISQKLAESVRAALGNEIPILLTRKSSKIAKGEPWIVSMHAEGFLMLQQRLRDAMDRAARLGAFVGICVCGERQDEHGSLSEPDGTACRNEGCGCLEYRVYAPTPPASPAPVDWQDPEDLCDVED